MRASDQEKKCILQQMCFTENGDLLQRPPVKQFFSSTFGGLGSPSSQGVKQDDDFKYASFFYPMLLQNEVLLSSAVLSPSLKNLIRFKKEIL